TNDGGFTSSSSVTVEPAPVPVTGVAVSPATVTVAEGLAQQLTAAITPLDADDATVLWSSDDEAVATVDASGLVTGVSPGTATVTATTNDGGFTSSSSVTVEPAPVPVTGVAVSPATVTVAEGLAQQLTAAITPLDADDATVLWSSDDEAVATVDASGLVTGVSPGTATVTATTNDGGFTSSSSVTVESTLITTGKWSAPIPFGMVPVAVANLPDGRLVAWSSKYRDYFGGADGFTYTEIFDPFLGPDGTALGEKLSTTNHDMFCPGINNMANGQLLVTGGSSHPKATLYDFSSDTWIAVDNMNVGRGYQGAVTLSDGFAFVFGGSWSGGLAPNGEKIAEMWRPETGWKTLPGLRSDLLFNSNDLSTEVEGVYRADNHAWLWAAPNGKIFHAGPGEDMHWFDVSGSGSSIFAGKRGTDTYSMKGTTVMFDIGKLLKVGGAPSYASGDPAKDNSYVIDINNESSVIVTPTLNNLSFSRTMHNSVVLPNGEVLVTGGLSTAQVFVDEGARLYGEIYSPSTNQWRTVAGMQIPRTYHSVSILMTDGRVFVGGGGLCQSCANHMDAEIYSPPYLFDGSGNLAQRPTISAPDIVDYNSSILVNGSPNIQEFSLIRMSSATHSTNNEQRRIPVTFSGNGTYALNIPDRNLLPPGYYMLFGVDDNGVPSIAETMMVGAPTVLVSGVSVSHGSLDMSSGQTQQLTATVTPANAEDQTIIWSSNDDTVATVDDNGLVTAVASGTAIIMASSGDGSQSARTNIIVDGGCTLSNVAIGGIAIQSSTYGNGVASLAVDGNTTGTSPWSADLQHTTNEVSPWWQIDLGSAYLIDELHIFNRTDKLQSRLANFYVFVSNSPISSQASFEDLKNDSNVFKYHFPNTAGLEETLTLGTNGRFIRIQLSESGTLHMAEVEVMGCIIGNSLCEGQPAATITQAGPYLDSDEIQTLVGSPPGGLWSGATTDGFFDPSIGPGSYTVVYTYDNGEGCIQSAAEELIVKAACDGVPPILISSFGPYLDTNPVQTLTANPAGGTWSGASTDGTFDPSIGEGIYTVTYTYDNGLGCVQTENIEIKVTSLDTECTLSNVALGGTASQSSTYGNGVASLAIDGNTTGTSPWSADLQHTQEELSPWWEVDLGGEYILENMRIFNRSDANSTRLNNFYLFVSSNIFPSQATVSDLVADPEVYEYYFGGQAGLEEIIALNTEGRYVRIQLADNGILHMAEVEVMGCFLQASPCDGAEPVAISPVGPFLDTDPVQALTGSPVGGTWSGASTDGTFDPGLGAGTYTVTYTYDNGAGCVQSDSYDIEVAAIGSGDCVLSNVALGRMASQSSTYGNGVASLAIDGNTSGSSPWSADLQHTQSENRPWWEVDLGADHTVDQVVLYNRSDGNQSRLRDFYVLVSALPFAPGASLEDLLGDAGIARAYFPGPAGPSETFSLTAEGRYVRVQLSGSGILHVAEVEVMGCPSPCEGAEPVAITPVGPFLDTDPVQALAGSPAGGTWSGASTDGTFDPGVGTGTYTVVYTYDDGTGCVRSDSYDIEVATVGSGGCVLSNVAIGGTATQSSTYGNGVASLAIDGNMTGTSPWSADLQHTQTEYRPWWEVDLGAEHTVDGVVIYNRSDGLQSRLNNFHVFVSPDPFPASATLEDLLADGNITGYYFTDSAGSQETIPLTAEGRYVRVQLSGDGTLHMAEVEVMGCPIDTDSTTLKASMKLYSNQYNGPSVPSIEDFNINLVPNPVSDVVNFEIDGAGIIAKLSVYDSNGKRIIKEEFKEASSDQTVRTLDVSHLPKGVYPVRFTLKDGREYIKKLLKE
uniref:galactose-binding domain-containing protein n=1 Tax=Pareuzebyella sediminis TaxID=2607998 RepID=UPI0011EFEAAB